ncbi:Citrate lyase subunit beta [Corynebacterium ramonii]|uniref:Citrate lyase subunit beta n=2 Tax=Corynebacteriaceae TaxID=1653 RepID=A0ABM5RQR1_9CORY|nr:Citrate lyase subunit beta [Corynebacterium ramonii FRC0011]ESU58334.1 citrate lyase subunit beta [Corynebacterium ulcerans NCTC 12077]STC77142.1 Citrate lyase subunit beta [Corynebacterium ulcerans]
MPHIKQHLASKTLSKAVASVLMRTDSLKLAGPAILFAPADRAEIIPKAAQRADLVILDLEDGAGDVNRESAYQNIRNAHLDPTTTFVRVVGPSDDHYGQDIAFVRETEYRNIIVPKVGTRLPENLDGFNVVPIIETPAALVNIQHFAEHPLVVGLYWGADDLTIGLGGAYSRQRSDESTPGRYRETMAYARSQTLIHAAAAGKWAMDAVYQDFSDEDGLYLEALDSARMGFALYPCIHPRQVDVVRRAFYPGEEQITWAQRIVEESSRHSGAFKLDGEMVDTPLITLAFNLLNRIKGAAT